MEVCYFTCIYCSFACPTCYNSMVVIPAQSDPSELLQLVALRVPLHHMHCVLPCSFRLSPGDGDTVIACRNLHNLKGHG